MMAFWKDPVYMKIRKRLHRWIHPYRFLIFMGILMAIVGAAVSSGVPILLKELIDKVFSEKNPKLLFVLPAAFFVLYSVKGVTAYLQALFLKKAALHMVSDVRRDLFSHVIRLPLNVYGSEGTGSLMSRVTNDTQILQGGIAEIIRDLIRNSFTAIGMMVALFWMNPKLTFFILISVPFTLIPIRKIGKKIRGSSRHFQGKIGDMNQHLSESLSSVRLIKSVGAENLEIQNFENHSKEFTSVQLKLVKYENMLSPIMESIGALGAGVAVWIGGYSVIHGTLTLGTLVGFITAAQMLYQPIKGLGNAQSGIQSALAAAERINEVLDKPLEEMNADSGVKADSLRTGISFEHVSFSYLNKEQRALLDVSMTIPAGRFVAIVGPSGSGKSTLVNLLPRFFHPSSGRSLWDGQDLESLDVASLRERIGLVTQDVILMNQTIRENLLYGLKREVSEQEISFACESANATNFIERLPHGLDTQVGERGVFLSGGERQRIALARVVLRDPSLLILDEATSALDSESEFLIQKALDRIMEGRTTIVIAHRLSTIRHAQWLYVIEGGRIVEEGTHDELLQNKAGRYLSLLKASLRGTDDTGVSETPVTEKKL
jgi:subfamily B ATP-binding cassette protein MsbA